LDITVSESDGEEDKVFVLATFSDCFTEGDISFGLYGKSLFKPVFTGVLCSSAIFVYIHINPLLTKFKSLIIRVLAIFIKHTFQSYNGPITFKIFLHQLMCCLQNYYTILSLFVTSHNFMPPYSRLVTLIFFLHFSRSRYYGR
jgi:hypothetical protein